jgi:hypothetical protein
MRRARRGAVGHVLVEALVGGSVILLVLAGLSSGEIASRRLLDRGIHDVELARAAAERVEFLRSQPRTAPAWAGMTTGPVAGHPGWTWRIEPEAHTDGAIGGLTQPVVFRRAVVTITAADGRLLQMRAMQW